MMVSECSWVRLSRVRATLRRISAAIRMQSQFVCSVGFPRVSEFPEPRPLTVIGHLCLLVFLVLAIIVPTAFVVAELVKYVMQVFAAL